MWRQQKEVDRGPLNFLHLDEVSGARKLVIGAP